MKRKSRRKKNVVRVRPSYDELADLTDVEEEMKEPQSVAKHTEVEEESAKISNLMEK